MKALVLLLLVGNLLFYVFSAGYLGQSGSPDAIHLEQQIQPERIRIVARGEAPGKPASPPQENAPEPAEPGLLKAEQLSSAPLKAEPAQPEPAKPEAAKPEPAKPEPAKPEVTKQETAKPETPQPAAAEAPGKGESATACLAWERLSVSDAERVIGMATGKFADFKFARKSLGSDANAWWVYIPPLNDKAEADKKAGELRLFGVADFFVIQEGPNRNAISLGVFSAEKGAQDRLAELKAKGVRSARTGPRPGKDGLLQLEASGPAELKAGFVAAAAKVIPRLEAQSCK